jgi:hypothetical protein
VTQGRRPTAPTALLASGRAEPLLRPARRASGRPARHRPAAVLPAAAVAFPGRPVVRPGTDD